MTDEKLFTPSEVAERVGVSPRTVSRWCRSGKIGSVLLGEGRYARWRVKESQLNTFMDERSVST
jgi:excisionase family DNA binding protein